MQLIGDTVSQLHSCTVAAILYIHLELQVVMLNEALDLLVPGDLGDRVKGDAAAPHVHYGTGPKGRR